MWRCAAEVTQSQHLAFLQSSPAQEHPGDKAQLSLLRLPEENTALGERNIRKDCKVPRKFQLSPGTEHQGSVRMHQHQIPSCWCFNHPFTTQFWRIFCSARICDPLPYTWIWKLLVHLMCLNIGNSNPSLSPTWSQCKQINIVNI